MLGGGGSTGNAWLIGVVAGLSEAGLDVSAADLTIGTSAGSTAAAQLACASPAELLAAAVAPVVARARPAAASAAAPTGSDGGRAPARPVVNHLERLGRITAEAEDPADLRRRLGASALELESTSDGSWQTQWRATVASRFAEHPWPDRAVVITAIDAETGEPVVFDRDSGVDLVDAVAASCSSGLPYRIHGRAYLDGGFRTNAENADLARGSARVLVLSPFGGRTRTPPEWRLDLGAQVAELRAAGSVVETVVPDEAAEHLFGANAMNPALREPAARAGHAQGIALAEHLTEFWA
ncbi:patatin-like phospholipase family protein [Agromyces allii]|uniref:Patatin-like phospholipase family protein n=1 Tax=Agromyces allii TaxID=393607 RepID=A0ABN2Q0A7_9MICO|nr:patatin-like phospholipase family protein [Agromyces allii]